MIQEMIYLNERARLICETSDNLCNFLSRDSPIDQKRFSYYQRVEWSKFYCRVICDSYVCKVWTQINLFNDQKRVSSKVFHQFNFPLSQNKNVDYAFRDQLAINRNIVKQTLQLGTCKFSSFFHIINYRSKIKLHRKCAINYHLSNKST